MKRDEIEDLYKLTPMQQAMLFQALYAPASGAYFNQYRRRLEGLDADSLARFWQRTVDRHPVLRTLFVWEGLEEPVQVVQRRAELPVERFDLSGLAPDEQQARVEAYLAADRRRGFDLRSAPLLRLALFDLQPGALIMALSYHHLVLDGWSIGLLNALLAAATAAPHERLAALPLLGEAERHQTVVEWSGALPVAVAERRLHRLFARWAAGG